MCECHVGELLYNPGTPFWRTPVGGASNGCEKRVAGGAATFLTSAKILKKWHRITASAT